MLGREEGGGGVGGMWGGVRGDGEGGKGAEERQQKRVGGRGSECAKA